MGDPLSPRTLVYDVATAGDPQISPDGRRVVYTLATADAEADSSSTHLWLCNIDGTDRTRLTWTGTRNSGARWSPDGNTIAFVSDRAGKTGIFLMPAGGAGEARELLHHMYPISDLAWSPDGAHLAYTVLFDPANPDEKEPNPGAPAPVRVTRRLDYKQDNRGYLNDARLHVWVADVATGERRRVSSALFDHTFPQWSPDGRFIAAKLANNNGMCSQIIVLEVANGESYLIGPETGVVGCWSWSPDGSRILYAGDTARTAQLDFFLYDVAAATTRRLTDDLQVLPDAGFPTISAPSQPAWLDDGQALFHAFHAGASALATIDTTSGAVEVFHGGPVLHATASYDAARRYIVQGHSSLEDVGEIAIFDRTRGEGSVITDHNAALLERHPMARWEKITIRRGNFDIDAWLLKPPDTVPGRRYPLILDVHGGPHGYYGHGFNAIQQCLATNGFYVLCTNPRGSGTYGRTFAQQVVRDWGGEDYQDLMAMVDVVAARGDVDGERLGIFGYSYGGYMTAWTIGQTDRFKAAVCGAPCFDLESMWGTSDIGHIFCEEQYGGAPHEETAWYAAHSPSTYAHRTRTPTLIFHGEADDRCPIGQGEQMFVALMKAGCEVEFARYPGGSHLFLRVGPPAHRADVLERILGWFEAHL